MGIHPIRLLASCLFALILTPIVAQQPTIVKHSLKNQRINELAVWNIGSEKSFEIFVTSVSGKVSCFAADTLEPLWEKQLSNEALTAPVIGSFMQNGAPILATATASGEVFFIWPASGEIISSVKSGLSLSLAPSVATTEDGDDLVFADNTGQLGIFTLNSDTGLPRMRYLVPNTLPNSTTFSVIGGLAQPPSCSDLNGDGTPEIIITSESGVLEIVSLPVAADITGQPQRFYTRLPQQSRATSLAGLGSLSESGKNLIILGVDASLQMFTWNSQGTIDRAIQPFMQSAAFGNSMGHILIGSVNSDPTADLVSTADGTITARYLGSDFSGKEALIDIAANHLTTTAPPFSPVAPVTLKNGSKALFSIDQAGTAWQWQPGSKDNPVNRFNNLPVPTSFTPAGNFTGSGNLSLVIWNERSFELSVVTFPVELAPTSVAPPSLTLGINYSRNGQWGSDWTSQYSTRITEAAGFLDKAKADSKKQEDSDLTTDSASIVAGLDPMDPLSIKIRKQTANKSNVTIGAMATLAALILAGLAAFLSFRRKKR